jgi:hypothetical protein
MNLPGLPPGYEKICPSFEQFVVICNEEGVASERDLRLALRDKRVLPPES